MRMNHMPVNVTQKDYRIYDTKGNKSEILDIVDAAQYADAVFIGESHGDPCAHFLELKILENFYKCLQEDKNRKQKRKIILSMEMFEKDVQPVIDEYIQDLISEKHFITAARTWPGYMRNYRPIVEFAKENKIPLIAANAPARYANRVSRLGKNALNDLSEHAKNNWLPPLPYKPASDKYRDKFKKFWEKVPAHNKMMGNSKNDETFQNFIDAQSLWDASMAFSISGKLQNKKNTLVLNINGIFHSSHNLGTPEHLLNYMPQANILTISIVPDNNFSVFNEKHNGYGDFIILTDPELQDH